VRAAFIQRAPPYEWHSLCIIGTDNPASGNSNHSDKVLVVELLRGLFSFRNGRKRVNRIIVKPNQLALPLIIKKNRKVLRHLAQLAIVFCSSNQKATISAVDPT